MFVLSRITSHLEVDSCTIVVQRPVSYFKSAIVKRREGTSGDVTSRGVRKSKVTWADKGREGGQKIGILG